MSSLENLKPLILGIAEIDQKIKDLQAKKKELEEEVRPALADRGPVQVDEYQVSVKTVPGRKTLDRKAVEAAFGDLSAFERVGKPYTTMTIKKVEVL